MLTGKAFVFGDDISTDHITPGRLAHLRSDLPELAKHVLEDADPTISRRSRNECLGKNALDNLRKLQPYLPLMFVRKRVDDPVDCLHSVNRMKSAQYKVSGFCRSYRRGYRLQVAHLADENHIRVMAKRMLQRIRKRAGIVTQVALRYETLLVLMQKLNRVFNSDHVPGLMLVEKVNHCRQGRALPAAGGTGNQNKATRLHYEGLTDFWKAKLLNGRYDERNAPECDTKRATLLHHIHAESGKPRDAIRKVELQLLAETCPLLFGRNLFKDGFNILRAKALRAFRSNQLPIDAQHRRSGNAKMQVRGTALGHEREQLPNIHACFSPNFSKKPIVSRNPW